ncbi:hypothetical protein [Parasutterella muris]|uniref:Uncharacterized protein n=1 Tax=Parasutterella muris TaxID=2565572 RepID=A0A6L6YIS4_9BURK|nr:hypothetical protein [Parasutterella muris]MVX57600.1 hypothetical protein [Parasutterella muris]
MKTSEKYTFILSEREAGIVLAALEFVLKLWDLVPFRDEKSELAAVNALAHRLMTEGRQMKTELEERNAQ